MKKAKGTSKKFLPGLAISLVLAMTVGSFALSETQTPASPRVAEAQNAVGATAGPFTVNGGVQGTNFDYTSPVLTIHSGNLTVSTNGETAERIYVDGAATITLADVNINTTTGAALQIKDNATFDVNILLADGSTNILKGKAGSSPTDPGSPGIEKNGGVASIGTLTIGVPDGSAGTGKLEATGGQDAAGIGGEQYANGNSITITGGVIIANGKTGGAGIGGGSVADGISITITGGVVTAYGGQNGAGIGGGASANGSGITISDGVVTAYGGQNAAGIGGGHYYIGSNITITGGEVTAYGGQNAAGIGGGAGGSGSTNTLSGDAIVLATSGSTTKAALEGFADSDLNRGITFTRQTTSGTWSGVMYGNVTLSQDLEIPANLTVPAGQILSIKEGKDVTLSEETGVKYTVEGELRNNGTVTLPTDLALSGNGKVTTKTNFYLDDSSLYSTGYQTYQTNAGVQKYKSLPNPYQDPSNGKRFINWYYLDQSSQQVPISESVNVLLNEHSFYDNSIEQFTVTFSVPTGTAPAAQTIDDGSKAAVPQISWTDGTVEGWYKENTYQNKWNFSTDTVTSNITLYAKFTCSVTFNSQGGSTVAGATVVYNNPVAEPTAPTRSGYRFDGWYKESACTNKWTFTTAVTKNTTLYAKWVQQFTVTFSVPTGTAPAAQTLDTGSKATAPQISWTDGTVEGWYKENTYQNKWNFDTDTVTSNITLYAKFTCSVTFNSQGGSTVAGATAIYNNPVAEPTAPTRSGYRFDGWYKESACTNKWTFTTAVTKNTTLYAKWVQQFTVTFSVPTGTAPAAQTLDTGSKATAPQISWTDGTVEGWYKENTYQNKWNFDTDTVTSNITLYAKFTCSVTFNSQGGSTVAGATVVYNNTVSEPTAPTRSGYRFDGWYKESACTNKWTFTTAVTKNTTLYAKWVQQFTATFSVPTGTAPAAQTLDTGSKATAPQISWTDGTVEGWYKENTYQNKWNFDTDTVTSNITLYAKFTCSVTFNSQGGSTVAGETVVYDNTVQEPDEPTRDDGYSFVEWCKDEECTTAWDFGNDKVQRDMTLYAKWIGDEHRVIIPTNPDDHGTVTTDPENPKTGEEVIITVTPEEGYKIDGLPIVKTEDGRIIEVVPTGNPNEYKFIMPDSNVTIEVHFVLISEPTVDPGVKTGDSFAGVAALAILGLAATGAALLCKRK